VRPFLLPNDQQACPVERSPNQIRYITLRGWCCHMKPQDTRLRTWGAHLLGIVAAAVHRFMAAACAAVLRSLQRSSSCASPAAAARISSSTCCTLLNAACRETYRGQPVQARLSKQRKRCSQRDALSEAGATGTQRQGYLLQLSAAWLDDYTGVITQTPTHVY
jgi:hypothetical protein